MLKNFFRENPFYLKLLVFSSVASLPALVLYFQAMETSRGNVPLKAIAHHDLGIEKLAPEQARLAQEILNNFPCHCGCDLPVARCLSRQCPIEKEKSCLAGEALGLVAVRAAAQGKNALQVLQLLQFAAHKH